jgi:hypothetical protein
MADHDIDRITLTSYFTGDLDREKQTVVEKHLETCEICKSYLKELEAEKNSFLSEVPFESLPTQPEKRRTKLAPFRKYYALAATIILFIAGGLIYQMRDTEESIRIKGETGIKIFSLDQKGAIEYRKNTVYYPGDRIQIAYSCTDKHFLILFSIDEKGTVSRYYPSDTDSSIILEKGADIPLPNSIALDDYIGRELFVALFSGHRVYLPDIIDQVEETFARNGLAEEITFQGDHNFDVHTVLITKAVRQQ